MNDLGFICPINFDSSRMKTRLNLCQFNTPIVEFFSLLSFFDILSIVYSQKFQKNGT
jgi:hypothetical protein